MRKPQAIAISKERGRHTTAFLLSLAFAFAALGLIFIAGRQASAAGDVMIGIDMTPGAESSAAITTCAAVQPGDTFDADVFISNAQDLIQWELRVDFNPDVVSLESADYGYFLTQSGGSLVFPQFEVEKPGRRFLSATEQYLPDSGSGVLARLHLRAVSEGTSPLTITSAPTALSPYLRSAPGVPFADTDGDGHFDGSLTGATVDVGRACSPSTPVVTPSPIRVTPTPKPGGKTPSPAPHPSGAPPTATPHGGGGGGQTPPPGGDQPTPVPSEFVINAPSPGGPGSGNDGSANGSSSDDNTSADSGQSADDQTGPDGVGGGQDIAAAGQSNGAGGGSSSLILIIAAAFAAVAVLVGATFLVIQARWKR